MTKFWNHFIGKAQSFQFGAGICCLVEGLQSFDFHHNWLFLGMWQAMGKDLYLQCSLETCSNSPGSPALQTPSRRISIRLSLHCSCRAIEVGDSLLQCLYPAWRPFAWTAEGWKHVSEEEAMWVCVIRKRGGKRTRKEGRHKEEMKRKRDGSGKYIWQYSDLCCCQRSSGSIQKICYLPPELHSLVPQWALRSCPEAQEAGKPLPSPEQLHLQKQLCFPWTSLAGADEPKTTEDSKRLTAAFVAPQGRSGSTGIQPPPNYSTTSMDHTHSACPGLGKGLLAEAGSTRSARYLKHSLITKNYLTWQLLWEERRRLSSSRAQGSVILSVNYWGAPGNQVSQ